MKNAILAATLLTTALLSAQASAEEKGKLSLETGMDYNTGKYGGSQSTEILYLPFTGKYQGKSWTLKLTVPYLKITGPNNVVNGVGATGTSTAARSTRSGMGDVIAAATRTAYDDAASGVVVNVTGKVKLATASSTNGYGLGTGKNDYALQADLYRAEGTSTNFGSIGYKIYGSPAGYALKNILYGSVGKNYKISPDANGGGMLSLAQKSTATGSTRIEAILFANQKLDKYWKAQGYLLKGFSNAVPDWGIGATIAYNLP